MIIKLDMPDNATVGDLITKLFPNMYFTEKHKNIMSNYFEDIRIKRDTWNEKLDLKSLKDSGIVAEDCIKRDDVKTLLRRLYELGSYSDIVFNELWGRFEQLPSICPKSDRTVEAIPQADYENRLKSDMVAMLEELDFRLSNYQDTDLIRQDIQQKINELKAETEET